jgi:hypothetical protein
MIIVILEKDMKELLSLKADLYDGMTKDGG